MTENYAAAHAASAQIVLENNDAESRAAIIQSVVHSNTEIADSEISATLNFLLQINPEQAVPALLFVVNDVATMRLNRVRLDTGHWPQTGEIVLERKALGVAKTALGQTIHLGRKEGPLHALKVSGLVHDSALAPATQEGVVYGYISFQTLLLMQEQVSGHVIKLAVSGDAMNAVHIEQVSGELVRGLARAGIVAHEIRIPPPGQHPHQRQMTGALRMLLMFGILALILGSVLVATIIWGMLVQQVRQIGVMKAIGATFWQILTLYAGLIFVLGLLAVVLGVPLGYGAGYFLIKMAANNLNLEITHFGMPWWIVLSELLFCLTLPTLAALLPIKIALNKTVRDAMDDNGISCSESNINSDLLRVLQRQYWLPMTLNLAMRNMLRKRTRLAMSVVLLMIAGAMFMASRTMLTSWEMLAKQAAQTRFYDLQVRAISSDAKAIRIASAVNGVSVVETWPSLPATRARPDRMNIVQAYPDGGHGGLRLKMVPAQTRLLRPKLAEGAWLALPDTDDAVLNQAAYLAFFADKKIGERILLQLENRTLNLRLVGIMIEPMTAAAVYVNPVIFASASGDVGKLNTSSNLRIAFNDHQQLKMKADLVERAFAAEDVRVEYIVTEDQMRRATDGHLQIMVMVLLSIAVVMAVVGLAGLATTMSASVAERSKEFAVQRTIGARDRSIIGLVMSEAVLISLTSYICALPLALVFSAAMVKVVGDLSAQPLEVSFSVAGALEWLLILIVGALAASLIPAIHAARLTISEVLTYG
ncbi:putative ABC transport system permease protein [Undibacterium sp. GrIS 1.8]